MGDLVKYFCSLSNRDAEVREKPRHLFSNDPAVIDAFIKREDRPGRGVFSAIGLYEPGTTVRNAATTKAVPSVVCDCDLKNMAEGRESVLEVLRALALPPSWIHDSGFGLRPGWDLKEPLTTDEEMRRAEVVMRRFVVLYQSSH
jgi:hypothetical protein